MRQHRKTAFTLIELLVVIAVISVLLAILLPALNMTREMGRRIHCSGNLRQLALAWKLYFNEYDDCFYKMAQANNEYGGWRVNPRGGARPLNHFVDLNPDLMDKNQAKLFYCPSDRGGISIFEPAIPAFDSYGTSYETNSYLIGPTMLSLANEHVRDLHTAMNPKMENLKVTNVDNPHSEVILMGDYPWWNRSRGYAVDPNLLDFLSWHGRADTYNVAFLDGHVQYLRITWPLYNLGEYTVIPRKEYYPLAAEAKQAIIQSKDP